MGFPGGPVVKNLSTNAGDARDAGSVPGSERSSGIGNGNPLQYSYLEDSMDKGMAGYSPRDLKESDTTELLSSVRLMNLTVFTFSL